IIWWYWSNLLAMASSSSSVAIAAALLLCILAAHGHGCCAKRSGGGGKKAHSHHAPPHAHVAPPPSSPPATGPPSYGYGSPPPPAAIPPPPAANSSSNSTNVDAGGWLDARATWYGAPKGAGPDDNGGACGFKNVNLPPFSAMTSCGNEPLFKDGKGCGSCYQDTVRVGGPPGVLRRAGDGDHHGHELLPGVPLPLRPQRHRLRRHGQGRPQRRAPPRRHHRHAVQEGAVPVPGAHGHVPRAARLQPLLPGHPGGVRERRRRRGPGGHHAVTAGRRRRRRDGADGGVGAHDRVVGVHLADGHAAPHAGPLLAAHHQRVRQDARRRPGHPRRLGAQRDIQLHHPVRLIFFSRSIN
uniref:Expansin-like EG45 domain-containing protein n=1 Tax=Aegilops tauschii subsp. strangulata TaxID=200361 RepID=A0A453J9J0_AEGTS